MDDSVHISVDRDEYFNNIHMFSIPSVFCKKVGIYYL